MPNYSVRKLNFLVKDKNPSLFWGRRRTRWRLGQSCNQARDSTAHRPLTLNIDARIRSRTFDHSLYPVKVKRLMDERARNNEYTLVDDLEQKLLQLSSIKPEFFRLLIKNLIFLRLFFYFISI